MAPEVFFDLLGRHIVLESYSLFNGIAIILGLVVSMVMLSRYGVKKQGLLVPLLIPCFIIGARLWNVAVEPQVFQNELHWYSFSFEGFSLYGGISASLVVVWLFSRSTRQDLWLLLDAFVMPMAISFTSARIACFLNGCCGGIATTSQLGIVFPQRTALIKEALGTISPLFSGITVRQYPTQLYELGLALLMVIPLIKPLITRKWPSGTAFMIYGTLFSLMRLLVLPLRELPYGPFVTGWIYPLIYGGLILLGIFGIGWRLRLEVSAGNVSSFPDKTV